MRARSSHSHSRTLAMSGLTRRTSSSRSPACRGLVLREDISLPANWRARGSLDEWLKNHNLTAIAGVDTRHLVSRIRDLGAPKGCLAFNADGRYDMAQLQRDTALWPGLEGMDLTGEVSCAKPYKWAEILWSIGDGYGKVQSRTATSSVSTTGSSATSCGALPISAAASRSCRHALAPRRFRPAP